MPNLNRWIEAQLKRGYSKNQIKNHLTRKGYPPKVVAEVDKVRIPNKTSNKNHPHYFLFVMVVLIIVAVIYISNIAQNIQIGQTAATIPQPPSKTDYLNVESQSLSGTLKEISNTAFILDSDGETITVPYNLAEKKFLIFKVQSEGLIPININDIKLGSMITILKGFENGVEIINSVIVEAAAEEPYIPEPPSAKSCKDFSGIIGEVSCEEALELALAQYPGEVKSIARAKISVPDADEASIPGSDIDNTPIPELEASQPSASFPQKDVWLIGISLENAIEVPLGKSKNIEVSVDRIDKTVRLFNAAEE